MYEKDLQKSALKKINRRKISNVLKKIKDLRNQSKVKLKSIKLNELNEWVIDKSSGNISHKSGKFFSIRGVEFNLNKKKLVSPMIFQPEVGILGILARKEKGIFEFLLQAKFEPGNKNKFQLSPTIQATKSNIDRVHGGQSQPFVKYFKNTDKKNIIINILQSEQGEKFFKKRNRNIIVLLKRNPKNIKSGSFFWLTISEIKELMQVDDLINMDTRSVISSLFYGDDFDISHQAFRTKRLTKKALHSIDYIKSILKKEAKTQNSVKEIDLKRIRNYTKRNSSISKSNNFYIKSLRVVSNLREVSSWSQPLFAALNKENYILILSNIKGQIHMLLNLSREPGIYNNCELGPSLHFIDNQKKIEERIFRKLLKDKKSKLIHQSCQSEEGGRFYLTSNRYSIIMVNKDSINSKIFKNKLWIGINQFPRIISKQYMANIQLRTLFALIKFF